MALLVLEDLIINLEEVSSIVPLLEVVPLPADMHTYRRTEDRYSYGGHGSTLQTTETKDVGAIIYFKNDTKQTTNAMTFKDLCQLIETR